MEIEKLKEFIQRFHPLPEEVLEELLSKFSLIELPANSYLLREGNICKDIWLIEKGLARHFNTDTKGKERNTWFASENSFTTEIFSLINKVPSFENIQLIEDSKVHKLSYSDILELQNKHHQFCIWYIKIIEEFHFNQTDKRINELQFLDATQRYNELLQHNPTFSQRISLGNIASYLNITQETLSRIRSKK
jgi:CRP/FNR family transcriptional regulator, anaerobic regulatory protein